MSGHSKWAKIKRQKGANDAKRGNLFTKLAKNITLAAKEGGGDITMNFALRLAVDKAKTANMPADNIKRAIDRAEGKGDASTITRVSYEALGPGGISVIIDSQTDNTNRTVSEVRNLVESKGGKIASTGSVAWKFEEKGLIVLQLAKRQESEQFGKAPVIIEIEPDTVELEVLELDGVEDMNRIDWETDTENVSALEVITDKDNFSSVLKSLESLNYVILSAELVKIAKEKMQITDENVLNKIAEFVESLEEHDDIESLWTNL